MVKIWILKSDKNQVGLELIREANTLDEASQNLPDGVYTTFRTYNHNKILRLQEHFDRLVTSAALKKARANLNEDKLRAGIRDVVSRFPNFDLRLRIHWSVTLPDFPVFIMGEVFVPIAEIVYIQGVSVQTIHLSRENPLSKSTSFITDTHILRSNKPANIHEYLLVGENDEMLEGMTSNVFTIKKGTIYTASSGILLGITRQLVLEAIENLSLPVVPQGFQLAETPSVDEIFLTSASRGVLAATLLDGQKVGSGIPGILTQRIRQEFDRRLNSELETI
jgi:branched-chain amino acid aminotransferase